MTTTPEIRTVRPETYATGLGEIIRAHRLYLGLSQEAMAARLGRDKRDLQRIERGKDKCPPGLLTEVETLSDQFAHDVETVLESAERYGGAVLAVSTDPAHEWDRLVAGRAAVETAADAPITLTIVGELPERSAG